MSSAVLPSYEAVHEQQHSLPLRSRLPFPGQSAQLEQRSCCQSVLLSVPTTPFPFADFQIELRDSVRRHCPRKGSSKSASIRLKACDTHDVLTCSTLV